MTKKILPILVLLFICLVPLSFAQENERYTVKQGDTLFRIARQHGLTVNDLKQLNDLTTNTIRPGQVLIVSAIASDSPPTSELPAPVFEPASEPPPPEGVTTEVNMEDEDPDTPASAREAPAGPDRSNFQPITRAKRSYTIQPGDTYYSIAIEHGVPAYAIFAMNGGKTAPLEPYSSIWIPDTDPIASFSDSDDPQTYSVKPGDTLYGIARKTGITVQALKRANGLTDNTLRVGQALVIPSPQTSRRPREQPLPPLYESGPVSMYPETFAGRITASGEPYDPERYTVSHPELALETIVLLTNPESGHMTFAVVTDRGPLDTRYAMDVSEVIARDLRLTPGRDETVDIRVIE